MKKPNIITKSELRSNIAKTTKFLNKNPQQELWISDNGFITNVMLDADYYSDLITSLEDLKKALFDLETVNAYKEHIENNSESFDSVEELMSDLNDDQKD
jgi:hypothetical protein